jgi:hypothetical protein
MRRAGIRALFALPLAAALCAPAAAEVGAVHGIAGKVLGERSPLPAASVYAYQLADASLHKVATDGEGNFLFAALPAGLYRIIAHKAGFVPGVVMLTRATADAYQFLELELAEAERAGVVASDDFWSVRAQLPADVLRDIKIAEIELATRTAGASGREARINAEMQAVTGVDQIAAASESQVTGGRLGIQGRVGSMRLGLRGDYLQLEPGAAFDRADGRGASGEASALSLEMAEAGGTRVRLTTASNRLVTGEEAVAPVDFERYGVSVTQPLGERSRSDFTAQYTSQVNFHRHGLGDPAEIPEASRSWRFEGSYTAEFSERSTIQTGVRYRELESALGGGGDGTPLGGGSHDEVDLFGRGGLRVRPALLVEYGLYTTLRDGSVSLIPRGGLVVQLGPDWQASTVASRRARADAEVDPLLDFVPAYFGETGACEQNEEACYQLLFTHQKSDTEGLSFGATHREYGDTRRVYFSEDFFNRLESLYLVPGDRVPEAQFAVSRQLTPTILTRLESSVGSGGGGTFYAADDATYENRVSYLVTSLDTEFQGTSTGLFLAFHQIRQDLTNLEDGAAPPTFEAERLQVEVTQNLNVLVDLAADWALKLNMELSRGTTALAADGGSDHELRKRLLGGIAIRF